MVVLTPSKGRSISCGTKASMFVSIHWCVYRTHFRKKSGRIYMFSTHCTLHDSACERLSPPAHLGTGLTVCLSRASLILADGDISQKHCSAAVFPLLLLLARGCRGAQAPKVHWLSFISRWWLREATRSFQ